LEIDILSAALASEIKQLRDPDLAPPAPVRGPASPARPAGK
jgi:hypothetical protein